MYDFKQQKGKFTFRLKNYGRSAKDKAQASKFVAMMALRVGCVASTSSFMLADTIAMLRKSDYFRHDIKMNAKRAEKSYYEYEAQIKRFLGGSYDIWLNYTDDFQERIKRDTQMLFQTVWNEYVRREVPDAKLKAMVETTNTLFLYSCCLYDRAIEEIKNATGMEMEQELATFRCTIPYEYWDNIRRKICKDGKGKRIELADSEDCRRAFQVVENIVMNNDIYIELATKTLLENKEVIADDALLELMNASNEYHKYKEDSKKKEILDEMRRREKEKRKRASDISKEDLERLKEKFNNR